MNNEGNFLIFTEDNIDEDKEESYCSKSNFSEEYLNILIINALFDIKDSLNGKSKTLLFSDFKELLQNGYYVPLYDEAFRSYFINNKDFKLEDDKISLVDINDFFLKTIHLDLNKYNEWGPHNNLDDLLLLYANSVRENGICDIKSIALIFIMRYKEVNLTFKNISWVFAEFFNNREECLLCHYDCESYANIPTDAILTSTVTKKVLFVNGINFLGDIRKYNENEIRCMLCSVNEYFDKYAIYSVEYTKFPDEVHRCFTEYEDKLTQEIIYLYNGFLCEPLSIAEIGKRYSMNLKEVLNRIDAFYSDYKKNTFAYGSLLYYFYSAFDKNKSYCYRRDIEKSLDTINLTQYEIFDSHFSSTTLMKEFIFSALKYGCYPVKYDKNLDIIYDSTLVSINDIVEEKITELGNIITVEELEQLDILEHNIVRDYYFLRTPKFYAKKKMSDIEIFFEIVNKEIRFYDIKIFLSFEESYDDLLLFIKFRYGTEIYYPSFEELNKITKSKKYKNYFSNFLHGKSRHFVNDLFNSNNLNNQWLNSISKFKLEMIRKNIRLLVARFGEYDANKIETHNHGFPHLSYPWNKSLLVSIVRKYFSDEFEVVDIDKNNQAIGYIIRSISK